MRQHTTWAVYLFETICLALLVIGISFRFSWVNWNQDTNIHPDEYGLTNTLTQLHIPDTLANYFNTRLSPISPYHKYDLDGVTVILNGPDNRMRWGQWPIILIRLTAEATGNTSYGSLRLWGRSLSAFADTLALLIIFLIGQRLYNRTTGLLAATLSGLAVMQIQQSHFMTVDNFAVLFTALAMYCATRAAQDAYHPTWPASSPPPPLPPGSPAPLHYIEQRREPWMWYILFGISCGMALASRINLLPLCGMILIAAFISAADMRLRNRRDLQRLALRLALAGLVTLLTFRIAQPMSFRAPSGDTTFFTLSLNPDWTDSMDVAQQESKGIGGGPPSEQWANRPAILFPLANMLLWGMGLPLGIMAWAAFLWAAWRSFCGNEHRFHGQWRQHLLPLVWVGGYFLFMGTRWVKSIRYFLPIYPFLCLFAAWGLVKLWQRADSSLSLLEKGKESPLIHANKRQSNFFPLLLTIVVIGGTLAWAWAFVDGVYRTENTRVRASRWIYQSIPGPFTIALNTSQGTYNLPIAGYDGLLITPDTPYTVSFSPPITGTLSEVRLSPNASLMDTISGAAGSSPGGLQIVITSEANTGVPIDQAEIRLPIQPGSSSPEAPTAAFRGATLRANIYYQLQVTAMENSSVLIPLTVVANENWDEGLPLNIQNYNAYGGLYRGITMESRSYDDENKRQMYLENLAQVDYIILPSQRAIWSASRIPLTYPMTMEYYRALFDGRLGFDLVALFTAPIHIGPLYISDVGGSFAWNTPAPLPLFNNSLLAAEEAFSVYDHAPVWIFKKRADFDLAQAQHILETIDLSTVVIQSPYDATQIKDWQPKLWIYPKQ